MKGGFGAALAARALLVLLLLVVFVAAVFIAGASLHDPDTCWLLALGKLIVETGKIPQSDPYSFTMSFFPERKFILYQWLSEVFFYLSYKVLDLTGLLLFAATVLTAAFVSVPLAFARKVGMPGSFAVVGTILTLLSAFFHFLSRPEIFSYLLLGIYFALTHFLLRKKTETNKIDWIAVTVFGVVTTLWCNLHSAFVLGLLYLFVFALVTSIADVVVNKRLQPHSLTIIFSFVAAFLGSFINPYGVGLWQYLPTLFFTPLNKHIIELRPISAKDFFEPTYYPFFLLLAVSLVIVARVVKAKIDPALAGSPRGQVVFAVIAVVCWGIAGFCCRRLIPFAALHLFAEGGYLLALMRAQNQRTTASTMSNADVLQPQMQSEIQTEIQMEIQPQGFLAAVDQKLDSSYQPQGLMWFVTIAVLSGVGVYFVASRIPEAIVLPQSGGAFQAPFKAVKAIEAKMPEGNLFNHPQFGDVLIWKMAKPPKLFIDTRFDMYGAELVDNYQTLYAAKPGWEELMSKYSIGWVFVRPDAEIAKRLRSDKAWRVVHQDKASIVLEKPEPAVE